MKSAREATGNGVILVDWPVERGERIARQGLRGETSAHVYGIMYGVKRTTIYLSEEQKRALEAIALQTHRTEADLIRQGVDHVVELHRLRRRKPQALFALSDPLLDDPNRVEEALEGFGED